MLKPCAIMFFSANASANRLALAYRVYPQHSNAHTSMLLAAKGRTHPPAVANGLGAFIVCQDTIWCSVRAASRNIT